MKLTTLLVILALTGCSSVPVARHFPDVPDELKSTVGYGEDNTVELQLFTLAQDQLRGINLWDYYR